MDITTYLLLKNKIASGEFDSSEVQLELDAIAEEIKNLTEKYNDLKNQLKSVNDSTDVVEF